MSNTPKEYIVVTYGYDGTEYLSDLWTSRLPPNVVCLQSPYKELHNSFFILLRRIHLSEKINRIVSVPFKHIWYSMEYFPWKTNQEYHIIFAGVWGRHMSTAYLKRLQKHFSVSYSVLLLDSFSSPLAKYSKEYIDELSIENIFTFDPNDAKKYGFTHTMSIYSVQPFPYTDSPQYDLYFVGNDNNRHNLLYAIYDFSVMHDGKIKYRLIGVPERDQLQKDGIEYYTTRASYSTIIEETSQSNCILEIVRNGQSGVTLRYYEAVCYNKKLLTTNKNVVNLPFYNPDYIHVFEKPEDIDWDWVKERIPIDYHYDKIIELEEEKERQQNAEKETS